MLVFTIGLSGFDRGRGEVPTYSVDRKKVAFRVVDGSTVILNLDTGDYYNLEGVGTVIWDALVKGSRVDEIVDSLKESYQVGEKQLLEDCQSLIDELIREKLIFKV